MTWNVQNLLPPGAPGGPADDAAYRSKLAALAAVIDTVAPDVLALQEVGDPGVLDDLAGACETRFPSRRAGTPDERGIRVALMAQTELLDLAEINRIPDGVAPVQYRDLSFDPHATSTTTRGLLSATVTVGGVAAVVMTAHFKSKLISYDRAGRNQPSFAPRNEGERLRYAGFAIDRRAADAMTARDALDAVLTPTGATRGTGRGAGASTAVVFCGDLNDEPHAATTQIVQGPGGSEIDLRTGSGFQTPDEGDGWRMWNLAPLLPAAGLRSTRIYRGRGELIDHIFASRALVDTTNLPLVNIVDAHALPSMNDTPPAHPSMPSDHAAVVATFTVPEV